MISLPHAKMDLSLPMISDGHTSSMTVTILSKYGVRVGWHSFVELGIAAKDNLRHMKIKKGLKFSTMRCALKAIAIDNHSL